MLAASGAFDCFEGTHRAQYFAMLPNENLSVIEKAMKFASSEQNKINGNTQSLFGDLVHEEMAMPLCKYGTLEPIVKLSVKKR